MAEINNDEKRITVSGEQIEEAVGKVPTIEADVKANKQNISALQTASAQHTADIAKNTADIALKANADEVYSREETDSAITAKVAEIVAGAPEEFDTLKEMSDWLTEHSDSAATMNTAIQANTKAIAENKADIEANTAEIEQNKSDILTARNELTSMSSKMLISSEAKTVASKGWYRVFSSTVKGTSRNGLILLGHNYGTHYTENYLLAFNCGHQKNEFNMIKRFYEISPLNVITKIRIVSKQAGPQNNECHIDIYYNYDAANTVYVSLLEDTENNVGRPFTPVKFTTAEIPEGYTSTEFDLTEKDIFDRLTALENK